MGFLPFEEKKKMRASTTPSLSKIAHSSRATLISVHRSAARSPQRQREKTTANSIGLNGSGSGNAESTTALARSHRPGLVLADTQLADGSSGLDAVNDLLDSFEVPVIFITAYPERYLTSDRPEPAFLVSKPYQPATLSALVSQALFFERNAMQRRKRAS
jgi:CheY-like chemotaxis protein